MVEVAASLTVVILTLNEERNIVECIRSVKGADEIIVVDSGSTDRTVELAAEEGARAVRHPMQDFADQRNYAASLATCDWILNLDADERVPPELWREIRSRIGTEGARAYEMPRLNHVFGRPMRHGGWYPHYQRRLIRRGSGRWERTVHETVQVDGAVDRLRQPLTHYGHPDISAFISKLNTYTSIEASDEHRSVLALSLLTVVYPPAYFLYKYIVQRGFLDGWRGFAVAVLLAYYRGVTFLKAIEHHGR